MTRRVMLYFFNEGLTDNEVWRSGVVYARVQDNPDVELPPTSERGNGTHFNGLAEIGNAVAAELHKCGIVVRQ
jgi:hypothetical protein